MRGTRNTAPSCTGLMFLIPFFQQRVAFPCVPGRNSSDREQGPLLRRWAVWFLEDLLPTILVAQKSLPSHLFASPCPAGQGECHCRVWQGNGAISEFWCLWRSRIRGVAVHATRPSPMVTTSFVPSHTSTAFTFYMRRIIFFSASQMHTAWDTCSRN